MTEPATVDFPKDRASDEDVEPVSYTWPIGTSEYITRKAVAQASADVSKILGRDEDKVPKGQMRVVALPLIPRLKVPVTDPRTMRSREVRTITPLTARIELSYPVTDLADAVAISQLQIKRIRTYLAFGAGEEVPIYAHAFTRGLTMPFVFPRDDLQSSSHRLYEIWTEIERKMLDGQDLLNRVPLGSRLARAINRSGASIIATDPEDSYLAAWTALELLAIEEAEGKGIETDKVRKNDLVHGFLKARGRSPGKGTVRAYYQLRNDVAHGEMALERFRDLLEILGDVRALAREGVVDVLQERGIVPKTEERFNSRILIHSWDGSATPKIDRFTDRFPPARVDQFPSRKQNLNRGKTRKTGSRL